MKAILTQSLAQSYSYEDYRKMVSQLLREGKSTGNEQSEALTHYSQLNEARMNRLDKTMTVPREIQEQLIEYITKKQIWLVLSEGWCGDAAQILPILHKMSQYQPKIELRIVFRDENEALMNLFLTNGTKSIPKLIILDKETLDVLGDFGPRPFEAKQLILDYKVQHGIVDETAKTELQKWYLHDKGLSTQKEVMAILTPQATPQMQ